MKNCLFKKLVFLAALTVGLAVVALFLKFERSLPDIPPAPIVEEEEERENFQLTKSPPARFDYDKARYDEIVSILEFIIKDKKHEVTFDQAANLLSLKDVAWDDISINESPYGQRRMYHFRGFYLILSLEKRIPGDPDLYDSEDMNNKRIIYLRNFPLVRIDGIVDPNQRVRIHMKEVAESVRSMLESIEKKKKAESLQR